MKDFKNIIRKYFLITLFLWALYTLGLTPFAFVVWKLTFAQWVTWWLSGIPSGLILNYPIGKAVIKFDLWIHKKGW